MLLAGKGRDLGNQRFAGVVLMRCGLCECATLTGGKPHEVPPMPAEAEVKPSVPSAQVLQEKEEERRSSVQG